MFWFDYSRWKIKPYFKYTSTFFRKEKTMSIKIPISPHELSWEICAAPMIGE